MKKQNITITPPIPPPTPAPTIDFTGSIIAPLRTQSDGDRYFTVIPSVEVFREWEILPDSVILKVKGSNGTGRLWVFEGSSAKLGNPRVRDMAGYAAKWQGAYSAFNWKNKRRAVVARYSASHVTTLLGYLA